MIPQILVEEFNYVLPEHLIPAFPMEKREDSKLLVYNEGKISHKVFNEITNELPSNVLLIFNDTKVFPARLFFSKSSGALIEIFCLNAASQLIFSGEKWRMNWFCFVGNLKKWKNNEILKMSIADFELTVELIEKQEEAFLIQFVWNKNLTFFEVLELSAEIPLPPYMNRRATAEDKNRYQTIYAKTEGSVAAPTAGLHFTEPILEKLTKKGIEKQYLTLHVGAGTFKPIKTEVVNEHLMHIEKFVVSKVLLESLLSDKKIIPVGTTSLRVLESLYWIGLQILENPTLEKIEVKQWEVYEKSTQISKKEALNAILEYMKSRNLEFIHGSTQILIMPTYQFKIISGLVTNFHQPKSTLLLLIAALLGNDWKKVYDYALANNFRFLSYGDSSLLLP
jgi:S-adenosylmethionine:tRNA ribosyltransferase-isomerase